MSNFVGDRGVSVTNIFLVVTRKISRSRLAIFLARKISLRLSTPDESQAVGFLIAHNKNRFANFVGDTGDSVTKHIFLFSFYKLNKKIVSRPREKPTKI